MSKGLLFWLIYIVCLLFGGYMCFGYVGGHAFYAPMWGVDFLLIGILGWGVYGAAVK